MENLVITERHLRERKSELLASAYEQIFAAQKAGAFTNEARAAYGQLTTQIEAINQRLNGPEFANSPKIFALAQQWLSDRPAVTV